MVQATSAERKLAIDKMKNWMLQECQQRNDNMFGVYDFE